MIYHLNAAAIIAHGRRRLVRIIPLALSLDLYTTSQNDAKVVYKDTYVQSSHFLTRKVCLQPAICNYRRTG